MTNNNTSVAIETLLYRNGLSEKDIADAFALFSGYDIDYADFYFQRSVSEGYVLEESIVKTGHYNTDMGVGVRAVCGEKSALAYSEEISRESLFEAVRTVRAIAQATDNQVTVNVTPKDGPKVLYRTVDPIEAADTDAKIKLLRSLDAHARSRSPLITQVTTSVGASHDTILIAKMDGTLIGDIRPLVRVNLGVIAEKDGKKEQGQAGGGGRFALDLYNEEVIEQYAREAVDAAVRNLDARPAPAGSIPVVLGNGWPGVLIHEAVGHGLEADFIRKGTSVFTDKVGQRVASPIVTVVDDGTIADELTGPVVKLAEGEFAVTIRKIKRLMTAAVTHGIELRALRRASRQKRRKKSGRKDSQKMFPIHSIRQLWVRQVFNIRCTFRNRGHSPIGQESNNRCLRNSYRIGTSFRRELFFRPAPHRRPLRFRVSPPPNKSAHPSRLVPRICRISRGLPSRDRQYRHRFRENES